MTLVAPPITISAISANTLWVPNFLKIGRYFDLYNWLLIKWIKPIILHNKLDSKTKH